MGVPSASRGRGGEPAPAEGERSPSHAGDEALRLSAGSGGARGGALPAPEAAPQPGPGRPWRGCDFASGCRGKGSCEETLFGGSAAGRLMASVRAGAGTLKRGFVLKRVGAIHPCQ